MHWVGQLCGAHLQDSGCKKIWSSGGINIELFKHVANVIDTRRCLIGLLVLQNADVTVFVVLDSDLLILCCEAVHEGAGLVL